MKNGEDNNSKDDVMMNTPDAIVVAESVFKRCPLCGATWNSRDDFLDDTSLHLNGYQGNIERLLNGRERRGLLLFTHRVEGCGTTLAFDASEFKDK